MKKGGVSFHDISYKFLARIEVIFSEPSHGNKIKDMLCIKEK